MRRILSLSCLMVGILVLGTLFASSVQAQDNVAVFMKIKLKHSQQVLKGLATEDFDLIAKNSQAMSLLCEDELWQVLQTPEYSARSAEFRRSVDAVTEAARKKNLEAATLGYVDVTLKCVNCHKYVRKVRMAGLEEFPQLKLGNKPQ
jgi:cytochrome c556